MEEKEQILRKLIQEELGKQKEVYELSEDITNEVFEGIEFSFKKMQNGRNNVFNFPYGVPKKYISNSGISEISIDINFEFTEDLKVTGSFAESKTVLLEDESYEIYVNLIIKTNTLENLKEKIESVISHELNHAFVYVKVINRSSRGKELKNIRGKINFMYGSFIKSHPPLEEFVKMIYLSNPMEVQARVQQTASELKYINSNDTDEILEHLLQFGPIMESRLMIAYTDKKIKELKRDDLEYFIGAFNRNIKDLGVKKIDNVDKFFEYWIREINSKGYLLSKKIFKLVADKKNIEESDFYGQRSLIICQTLGLDYYKSGF